MTTNPDVEGLLRQMSAFFDACCHPVDQDDLDRGRRILTGELTYEQAYAEIISPLTARDDPQHQ